MFTLLDKKEYIELLNRFSWSPAPVDYDTIPMCYQNRSCDEAIQDMIVQLCLTETLAGISDVSLVYVPKTDSKSTFDNLLCFFKYVYQIGERDDFFLYHVCFPKEHALNYYKDSIDKNILHFLFVKSWKNRHLLSKLHLSHDCIEMIYQPESKSIYQNNAKDKLMRYIKKFSFPVLLNIPLILHENEFEQYDLFRTFDQSNYRIFLSAYQETDKPFVSQSVGIYNRSSTNQS